MATSTKLFAITATTDDTPLITETVMFAIKTYTSRYIEVDFKVVTVPMEGMIQRIPSFVKAVAVVYFCTLCLLINVDNNCQR